MPNPREQSVPQNVPIVQFEIFSGSTNREVQAIHTFRSSKRVDNQVQNPPNNHPNVEIPNKEKEKEVPKESTKKYDQVVDTQERSFLPKASFPQHL